MKKACAEVIVLRSLLLGVVLGLLGSSIYLVGCQSIGPAVGIAIDVYTNQVASTTPTSAPCAGSPTRGRKQPASPPTS